MYIGIWKELLAFDLLLAVSLYVEWEEKMIFLDPLHL